MRYINSWLTGLGLEYIIPKLKANGITTPKKLAMLSLRDMYEVVGVEDAEDRKKLYFLIQRLHGILNSKGNTSQSNDEDDVSDTNEASDSPASKNNDNARSFRDADVAKSIETNSEDDLKILRKNRKSTPDIAPAASESKLKQGASNSSNSLNSTGEYRGSIPLPSKSNKSESKADTSMQIENTKISIKSTVLSPKGKIETNSGIRNINTKDNKTSSQQQQQYDDYDDVPSPPKNMRIIPSKAVINDDINSSSNNNGNNNNNQKSTQPAVATSGRSLRTNNRRASMSPPSSPPRGPSSNSNSNNSNKNIDNDNDIAAGFKSLSAAQKQLLLQQQKEQEKLLELQRQQQLELIKQQQAQQEQLLLLQQAEQRKAKEANRKSLRSAGNIQQQSSNNNDSPPVPIISAKQREKEEQLQQQQQQYNNVNQKPPKVPASSANNTNNSNHSHHVKNVSPSIPLRGYEGEVEQELYNSSNQDDDYDDDEEQYAYNNQNTTSDDDNNDNSNSSNNAVQDMAIRVVVRKRPLSRAELARGEKDVMEVRKGGVVLVHEPKTKVDLTKVIETQPFTFDDAFEANETNEVIYSRTIKHLVNFVFDGGKASCFAYGQTGSGKTFSMMGSRPDAPAEAKVNAGLYVLAARDIFNYLRLPEYRHLKVFVSCFEIYGGKLFDLLNERSVIKCLEDAKQQVQTPGLSEHQINNVEELLNMMASAHHQRSTGTTGANEQSSRSHQIMQILLKDEQALQAAAKKIPQVGRFKEQPKPPAIDPNRSPGGKLSFIDLAGSERGADTTHNNKQTRMEGAEINTSLLALKEVIRSLERKHGHTPFRGSKLTQVLKDSFVGDKTRTCMVACVSPSNLNCEHTLNTLRYADRVKEHVSEVPHGNNHVGSSNYDSMAYDYNPSNANNNKSNKSTPLISSDIDTGASPSPAISSSSRPQTANSILSSNSGVGKVTTQQQSKQQQIPQGKIPLPSSSSAAGGGKIPIPQPKPRPTTADPNMEKQHQYTNSSNNNNNSRIPGGVAGSGSGSNAHHERSSSANRIFDERLAALEEENAIQPAVSSSSSSNRRHSVGHGKNIKIPQPPKSQQQQQQQIQAQNQSLLYSEDSSPYEIPTKKSTASSSSSNAVAAGKSSAIPRAAPAPPASNSSSNNKKASGGNNKKQQYSSEDDSNNEDESEFSDKYYQQPVSKISQLGNNNNSQKASSSAIPSAKSAKASAANNNSSSAKSNDNSTNNNRRLSANLSSNNNNSNKSNNKYHQPPPPAEEEEEEDDDEYDEEYEGITDNLGSTELIQRTVGLLSAHKLSIAEMVEVMKVEMELVQDMENIDDRDSDMYLDKLERILDVKNSAIDSLREELASFQQYRMQSRKK